MSSTIQLNIPDLGDATSAEVIEILVKPGDAVTVDQPLIVLEGEKASMEIPAEQAGEVVSVMVNLGDQVSSGTAFVELTSAQDVATDVASPDTDAVSSDSVQTERVALQIQILAMPVMFQ